MNKVILMGRLTRDPEVRYSAGENSMAIARYTLAVDRRFSRRDGEQPPLILSVVLHSEEALSSQKSISVRDMKCSCVRKDSDRQLYEQRRPESIYYGCGSRGSGICRE